MKNEFLSIHWKNDLHAMDNIAQIYMLQMQPVSLFPTPGGPTIASTNGSDETAFLLNSQTDMALIILSIAFC